MSRLDRAQGHAAAEKGIAAGGCVYVIALFNPHVTALSNLSLYLPWLAWLYLIATEPRALHELCNLRVVRWMLITAAALFAAAIYSPERAYSLSTYRKEWFGLLVAALTFGAVFATPRRQGQLLLALGAAAAAMVVLELVQYARELAADGGFSSDIARHRWYADSLIYFLPAVLALAWLSVGRQRAAWAGLLCVQLLLLAGTSSRGAWLGAALGSLLAWPLLRIRFRTLLGLATAGAVAIAIAALALPASLTDNALERGVSTTLRDEGTWGPSYEMILEQPLLGFGYGKNRFHEEFNRRAGDRPWWVIRQSLGPHSTFLQVLFSAGLVGFVPFVVWLAALFGSFWSCARAEGIDRRTRALCFAGAGALVAFYFVRGFVEVVRWAPLGVIGAMSIGIALHTARSRPREA